MSRIPYFLVITSMNSSRVMPSLSPWKLTTNACATYSRSEEADWQPRFPLRSIKANAPKIADRPHSPAFVHCAWSLCAILDHSEPSPRRKFHDFVHLTWHSQQMHGNNRLGTWRDLARNVIH